MTAPTKEAIAERIRDLRGDAEDVRNWNGSASGDAMRWRMLRAADALEALSAERDNLNRALWVALGGVRPVVDGMTVGIDGKEAADAIKVSKRTGDHRVYCRRLPPPPASHGGQTMNSTEELRSQLAKAEADSSTLRARIASLKERLKPFAKAAESWVEEHEIAAKVGGYVPLDDDIPIEISFGDCERARTELEKDSANATR